MDSLIVDCVGHGCAVPNSDHHENRPEFGRPQACPTQICYLDSNLGTSTIHSLMRKILLSLIAGRLPRSHLAGASGPVLDGELAHLAAVGHITGMDSVIVDCVGHGCAVANSGHP